MTDDRDQRVKELLAQLLDTPATQRARVLELVCAGDVELQSEVESLARAFEDGGDFLATAHPTGATSAIFERAGSRIDRYTILEKIGEGGFGTVFLAEQQHPVRRTVALKILKAGMDTKQVIARFSAERQALAMMDHPNIARVLDAGATDAGRPYFVMDLIRGTPITRYCDERKLSIRQRLELFAQVCRGVQHAHTKGIIHRDLKPSNVLVTESDGGPVPKVIDFGIAKATDGRLTDQTLSTQHGQWMGTPPYMSPEQISSRNDLDTRADVYMLGALLYELVAGKPPFHAHAFEGKSYVDIARIIGEVDPPRPSIAMATSIGAINVVASCRHTDPQKLRRLVQGDLDWIIMKCLEKDRARRYQTTSALARDIERYLSDEPVEASPPSRRYIVRKFARRHRAGLVGLTIFTLLSGGAITLSLCQDRRVRRAETDGATQKRRADEHAAELSSLLQSRGEYKPAELMLEQALRGEGPGDHGPALKSRRMQDLAGLYFEQGEYDKSQALYAQALEAERANGGMRNPETRRVLYLLASVHSFLDQDAKAEPLWLEVGGWLLENPPQGANEAAAAGMALSRVIACERILHHTGKASYWAQQRQMLLEPSRSAWRREMQARLEAAQNAVTRFTGDARILAHRGLLYARLGRFNEAASDFTKVLAIDPRDQANWHCELALLIAIGDLERYRQLRTRELELFSNSKDRRLLHRVADDCLLSAADADEAVLAGGLADKVLAPLPGGPWCLTKGASEFRLGHYQQAVPWLVKGANGHDLWTDPLCKLFLAMAYNEMGRYEQARAALDRGILLLETYLPKPGEDDLTENRFTDWIACQAVRREAEATILRPDSRNWMVD